MKYLFILCHGCLVIFIGVIFGLFFLKQAEAATFSCTTTVSGTWNWSTAANWATCNATYPGGIAGNVYNVAVNSTTATTINLDVDITTIGTITIIGNGVAHTVNFNGHTLTSSGTTTINAPTAVVTNSIAVDTGTFNSGGSITIIAGSASTRISQLTATTGTITVTGSIIYGGTAAGAIVSVSSTGKVIATSVGAGGVFTEAAATGTLKLTGAAPVLQVGATYIYNNVEFAGSGTGSFSGTPKTINGTLTITSGTLDFGANAITVSGATTVGPSGTATFSSATSTKIFTGDVTISGTWNETAASAITFGGSLANNGSWTASTGVHTFSGTGKSISGTNAISIPNLTISGTTTNSSTVGLTVSTALSGASTLTQGTNANLIISGTSGLTTLTATAVGNVVTYNGSGVQTIKGTTYDSLVYSGSSTGTLGTTTTINTDLTISSGTVVTGANTVLVSGTTTITGGTLTISSTTGTKTFGDIVINAGGLLNFTAAEAVTVNGNLQVNSTGAISGTTGLWTFQNASSGTISGTTVSSQTVASATFTTAYSVGIPFIVTGALTVTGVTLTNNATLTATGSLVGTGTLLQGVNGVLKLGGTNTITTLDATTNSPNTVSYTGVGAQTIRVIIYSNLTYAGSNTGTLGGSITVNNNFAISSGTVSASTFTLTIGGNFSNNGTFTSGTGTVVFIDPTQISTITNPVAGTSFTNFTVTVPGKSLVFDNANQTNVTGTLTLNGQSCQSPISLVSNSSGNTFKLNASGAKSAQYVSLKDANWITNSITATNSVIVGNSNWVVTGDTCAGRTSAWSFQRKTFYDTTNSIYWRFSYDGTQIKSEYNSSPWNSGWTASSSVAANTNDFSVWGDGTYVFIAYANNNDIMVARGTLTATSVSWGSSFAALNGTSAADTYLYPSISEDSAHALWVSATYSSSLSSLSYSLKTVKSGAVQDPSTWGSVNTMANTNSTNADIYGVTVPLATQNMLTVYEVNGTVFSQLYSNGSGYAGAVSITATANTSTAKNFSVSTDGSNTVHLAVIDTSSFVQYYKYTGSWSGATRLDTSATNQYVTVTVDSSNNDIYVMYYRSSAIYYKYFHTSWSSEGNSTWVNDATVMNLASNYADSGSIYAEYQTGSSPYVLNWQYITLPSGILGLNVQSSTTLSAVTLATTPQNSTGSLGVTSVSDYRGVSPGWSLTATVSNFINGVRTIPVTNFTINPSNGTLSGVTGVTAGSSHVFSGTSDPATVMTSSSPNGKGVSSINPGLSLSVPVGSYWGSYTATVTLTVN